MNRQIMRKIIFMTTLTILTGSCSSITNLFPKEPRPFEKRPFNADQWKSGDYQTRGEMVQDLRRTIYNPQKDWKKSADEVRQILGKPDVVTQAECCYTRRGVSPPPVEVWLYYVEIEENYDYPRSPGEPERKILPQAFKLYFSEDNSGVVQL